ncbi:MAG: pyridoxamine 5'-phosphate oxidase family protein [Chloroflexi bacterium]|nr:pyridoxamine 5'-phosphate oxidase family protein [Chloroflexota bacterium]
MKTATLETAVELANKVGYVFVSTADANNWPHVAVARTMALKEPGRIEVNEWFCPGTMSNLQTNSHVSVVVWDAKTDTGYQLLGDMEHVIDIGMIDGYTPDMKSKFLLPQIKSQLIIRVNKVTDFKRAPHTDVEE